MKIVSGILRGMPLRAPHSLVTRPTSSKARAAIMDMMRLDLPGCRFLDGFSGTGAMGLEAGSRGARSVVFIESNKEAFAALKNNIDEARRRFQSQGIAAETPLMLAFHADAKNLDLVYPVQNQFDFIWLDPPYSMIADLLPLLLPGLTKRLSSGGRLVLESDADHVKIALDHGLEVVKSKSYGKTRIDVFTL